MAWHRFGNSSEGRKTDNGSRHFGLDICLILIAGAFIYAVFHMNDPVEDLPALFRSHFPEGLVVGIFIGLTRYFRRKEADEDQLQEEQELAEQKKAEEYGHHNYRSSGM